MSDQNEIIDKVGLSSLITEATAQSCLNGIELKTETVSETIHFALKPLSNLVWDYDRIADYLNKALTERFINTPLEDIITPNPSIAGPSIESLRFSANEPLLREIFANLIATAMDARTVQKAHPAFVELTRQLCPDEARILKYISSKTIYRAEGLPPLAYPFAVISGELTVNSAQVYTGMKYPIGHFSFLEREAKCEHPQFITTYLDNLCRLGITEFVPNTDIINLESDLIVYYGYSELRKSAKSLALKAYRKHVKNSTAKGYKVTSVMFYVKEQVLRLSALGIQFCEACISIPKHL